jgi:hypothetical protein
MAMLDQPVPQARSATRADGSPRSRRSTSAMPGSHCLASRLRNSARLNSGRPSGAHGSEGGAPPLRAASATSGIQRAARTISVPLNAW